MKMSDLNLLVPPPPPPVNDAMRWVTVTQESPLRVRFDGETDPLPVDVIDLVGGLAVNDRVWTVTHAGQVHLIGTLAGGAGGGGGGGVPAGVIQAWAGSATAVPAGWLLCNGAAFTAATYPALAAALGTTYGGTAESPLLPNLQGRIPVGLDAAQPEFDTLGEKAGAKTHTLTATEMPSHTHGPGSLKGIYRSRGADDGGSGASGALEYTYSAFDAVSHDNAVEIRTGATAATGGSAAHNNLQPYIVLNYIIRAA